MIQGENSAIYSSLQNELYSIVVKIVYPIILKLYSK